MITSCSDTTSSELCLTFGNGSVILESGISALFDETRRSFRAFVRPVAAPTTVRLTVTFVDPTYHVFCDDKEVFSSPDLEVVAHRLRHMVLENLISFRPDLLWLHAGGAVRASTATLIVGSYGSGKSSIVTALCRIGWHYLSDDVAPIDLATNTVLPFPLTPFVREDIGWQLNSEQVGSLPKSEVALSEECFQRAAVPVGTLVFPRYVAGENTSFQPFSPAGSALELFKQCINRKQLGQPSLQYLTSLASQVPILHLTYNNADHAAALLANHIPTRMPHG